MSIVGFIVSTVGILLTYAMGVSPWWNLAIIGFYLAGYAHGSWKQATLPAKSLTSRR
jgi:hypothetical protein